jgi:tRNA (mo5U34)-methyltransferase
MRKLSGEFLSKIIWTLQQCNIRERSGEELRELVLSAFEVEDLYVDLPDVERGSAPRTTSRSATFDPGNLDRLNVMLPWSSYAMLGNGATLGSAWSSHKRASITAHPDPVVEALNRRLPLDGLSVLELGCFEGHHSLSLAAHCREVWAIDGRIENVVKTLVRVWLAGAETKITCNLLDLEKSTLRAQLAALGRTQPFDVVHHRGVLYHLSNPIANLAQCAEVCTGHLYLHTQIARDAQADAQAQHSGASYDVFRYKEPKTHYAPFAGITEYAQWLTESSLHRLLRDIGFASIDVLRLVEERNGLRIELIASR